MQRRWWNTAIIPLRLRIERGPRTGGLDERLGSETTDVETERYCKGMTTQWEIGLDEATGPLVLALDVGSTASRGALYESHGRPVRKRLKIPHSFISRADGTSEIDPDRVVAELSDIIDRFVKVVGERDIAGAALDTFASSLIAVDEDGKALTPCMTYADSRPHAYVDQLRSELSESDWHQLTGTRFHSSYWPARLRWLRAEQPEVFARASRFLSLGDYVLEKLTGTTATSTAAASWAGMVDRRSADWADAALEVAGITREQVPPIHHLDQPLIISDDNAEDIANRWYPLRDAQWFAAIGDGLSANVGLGAGDDRTIGGTAATSGAVRVLVRDLPETLPGGLWCYRVSHDRALVGGALNDVGRALTWASGTLSVEDKEEIEASLAASPDASTPLALPFFTGERSTGWSSNARAVFTGVSADSDPLTMHRAVVEGIALSYARIAEQMRELAPNAEAVHIGGSVAAEHPGALQIIADALGIPLTPVNIKRSTLLGTALLALETVAPDVERIDPHREPALEPKPEHIEYYRERYERFNRVYDALFG